MLYFRTVLLNETLGFINGFTISIRKMIYDRIHKAEESKDSRLFKKLHDEVWEFRFRYGFKQVRLLAFWDKSNSGDTLVVATHGFLKKTDKVPGDEITRALNIRAKYFEQKK